MRDQNKPKEQLLKELQDLRRRNAELESLAARNIELNDTIRKNEVRLRESQKLAHVGNWEYDVEKDELWWSDELYNIFQIKKQKKISVNTFLSCVHPDDISLLKKEIQSGASYRTDYRIVLPNKEIRYIHEEIGEADYKDGKLYLTRGTAQDLTELKQAEKELQLNAECSRRWMESSFIGIIQSNAKGEILDVNDAFLKIVTDMTSLSLGSISHPVLRTCTRG